jgi:N-acetylglucosamine kinase-like BadF-type ATPase
LGTGSNSCSYDGEHILDNVTNLGYLLGDEGSGTHIGKLLIKAYFYRDFPADLIPAFETFISGGKTEILNKVYGPETPNRYLATFARFANTHKSHPFVQNILRQALGEFLDSQVVKYEQFPEYPLQFVGSIAYHFKNILFQLCRERGATPERIIQKPIEHLLHYHVQTAQL